MRKTLLLVATAALIVLPASTRSQETDPKQEHQQARGSQAGQSVPPDSNSPDQGKEPGAKTEAQTGAATQIPVPQDSLAAAARKAREQKKESSKPVKVFTNDDIPTSGGISSVGVAAATTDKAEAGQSTAANDEKTWRDKFAKLHQKLSKDTADLDVMQRELGVLNVQYYNDPVKAMQQQLTRDDINKKATDIETKKKDIAADQQAIDDGEDDLRKAGGDPGWAR